MTDLFLREVGNVTRHGGCDDQAASSSLLEVSTDGLGTVEDAVQVSADDLVPLLDARVENTGIGCPSSIGNHHINLAEVLDDIFDELLHILVVTDIALVGL